MSDDSLVPQADWYPDPDNSRQLRYWDGQRWTDHTSPAPEESHALNLKGWDGRVSFDGTTVTISKGISRRDISIPIGAIGAVTLEGAGVGMRAIHFSVAGVAEAKRSKKMLGDYKTSHKDPYSVTFRSKHLPAFQDLVDRINEARGAD